MVLSSVLNSDKAIDVNIQIMKIFVHMRHYALSQNTTNEQIAELRKLLMLHIENSDCKFSEHDAIRQITIALNRLSFKNQGDWFLRGLGEVLGYRFRNYCEYHHQKYNLPRSGRKPDARNAPA